mmetsp:Transcript_34354/g.88711  ORF Transcript_34354/g.88711 Transcript_34354/m.88711 type:complete len:293 (-) Transcript_34354:73-951(-)
MTVRLASASPVAAARASTVVRRHATQALVEIPLTKGRVSPGPCFAGHLPIRAEGAITLAEEAHGAFHVLAVVARPPEALLAQAPRLLVGACRGVAEGARCRNGRRSGVLRGSHRACLCLERALALVPSRLRIQAREGQAIREVDAGAALVARTSHARAWANLQTRRRRRRRWRWNRRRRRRRRRRRHRRRISRAHSPIEIAGELAAVVLGRAHEAAFRGAVKNQSTASTPAVLGVRLLFGDLQQCRAITLRFTRACTLAGHATAHRGISCHGTDEQQCHGHGAHDGRHACLL